MATLNLGRVRPVFLGAWSDYVGQTLVPYDVVLFAGSAWVVTSEHTPVDGVSGNQPGTRNGANLFTEITEGLQWLGSWNSATRYYPGQLVKSGPSTFVATQISIDTPPADNPASWSTVAAGFGVFTNAYQSGDAYAVGEIVTFRGSTWICTTTTVPNQSPASHPNLWEPLTLGFDLQGEYSEGISYSYRQVVTFHGGSYVVNNEAGTTAGEDPNESNKWTQLTTGIEPAGTWNNSTEYIPGDWVAHENAVYISILRGTGQRPEDSPTYWELLLSNVNNFLEPDLIDLGSITDSVGIAEVFDLGNITVTP